MNKKRLLKLADLLEADARNKNGIKFDFLDWGKVRDPKKPTSCGTTACAMGLAAISGAFKRAGLTFEPANQLIAFKGEYGAVLGAMKVFDLNLEDASFLFTDTDGLDDLQGAKAERAVAKRIRRFVAGKISAPV